MGFVVSPFMRNIFTLLFFVLVTVGKANSNVIVYSNTGYKFWLIVNGQKLNDTATERVVFSRPPGFYNLRVIVDETDKVINDTATYVLQTVENYDYVMTVKFDTKAKIQKVEFEKKTVISSAFFNGDWNLQINDFVLKNVRLYVSLTANDYSDIVLQNSKGEELMEGKLDNINNAIEINKITSVFFDVLRNDLNMIDRTKVNCYRFYRSDFQPKISWTQQNQYLAKAKGITYFIYDGKKTKCDDIHDMLFTETSTLLTLRLYK